MIHYLGHRSITRKSIAFSVFLCLVIATAVLGQSHAGKAGLRMLWQNMPFIALNNGDFEGTVTTQDAASHGNMGIGAAQDLNGEVILANGRFYSFASTDGTASAMQATDKLAYVAVGNLETPEATVPLKPNTTLTGTGDLSLYAQLKKHLTNPNVYYAIRITGGFEAVKARSFPKTVPYRPVCQITANPYSLVRMQGTMVGFFAPSYMKNLNSANSEGFHFHFINNTYDKGGHVLDFVSAAGAQAALMRYDQLDVGLPNTEGFSKIDLRKYYEGADCPK